MEMDWLGGDRGDDEGVLVGGGRWGRWMKCGGGVMLGGRAGWRFALRRGWYRRNVWA